jgi:NAD(P)-dependent dehydrogenase (short-subunit alcohol dehydrogenase family)
MSPQVVVITGGTAGVGRAVARRFAVDGAHIALLARGRDALDATAREILALGGKALPIQVDVAVADQVDAAAERIERELGPIDVWINNAMTTVFGRADDVSPHELARVTDVTYHGTVWGTLAALRAMRPRNRGTIVQVGSALSHRSIPLQSAYCAAKHAVRGFTDSLRSELHHDDCAIDLVMVQLPAINTPQFRWCENKLGVEAQPVPPIYQPELAADAIHLAVRQPRREVLVAGPTIEAVLGHKLAPGLLDHYLARRGYDGQLTGVALAPRPSNLWSPVPGDHGAHGVFELRARRSSPLARVASWLGAAGVQAVAAAIVLGVVVTASATLARAVRA